MKENSSNSSSENKKDKKEIDNKEKKNENEKKPIDFINCILFSKYKIVRKITEGNFSHIYQAINSNGDNFCCKIEPINSPQLMLENESKIMDYLRGKGIPNIKLYGQSGEYNILIMELLGKSLDYYIKKIKKFSIKTTVMLAYQMLDILEFIHLRHIIHRDIKPANFLMGLGKSSLDLFLIDFGFAKKYRSNKTCKLNPMTKGHKLTGTARFASINAMKGLEQSCRDDLESLGYLIYYFLKGRLPWQGLKANKKEDRYKKIYEVKKSVKIKDLCSGFPEEFESFYNYVRKLEFEQVPDYDYLKSLLKIILAKNNYIIDYFYDWDKEKPNISKDDSVFKNNYNIKYNGKEEWLIRKEDSNLDHNSNEIIYNNNNNPNRNNNITNKIYYKPVIPLKHQIYKKSKSSFIFNNNQPPRTAENSYNDSKYFESNYTTSKKNI